MRPKPLKFLRVVKLVGFVLYFSLKGSGEYLVALIKTPRAVIKVITRYCNAGPSPGAKLVCSRQYQAYS